MEPGGKTAGVISIERIAIWRKREEAWVFNAEDAIEKINYLNSNPEEYKKLLELERNLVQQFVIDYPKFWLEKAVELKKETGANKVYKYSNAKYFSDIVKRYKNKKKRIDICVYFSNRNNFE